MRYGKPRLQGRVGSIACLHRRAPARESPEERERLGGGMREARARESLEEDNIICPLAFRKYCCLYESREGETRRRANAEAMREARARRIADRGWSHNIICPLAFRKYCCSRP